MQNKLILLAALSAFSVSAIAGPTLADLADADAQLKMAELQAKVNEAKAKAEGVPQHSASGLSGSNVPLPGQAPSNVANTVLAGVSDSDEEIHLEAIYGVGSSLKADVSYNGSSTTLSMASDGVRKVGPWTLHEITPYHVVLTRAASKKGGKQDDKEMFVSSSTETSGKSENLNLNTSPTSMPTMSGGMMGAPALPPVPALPMSRTTRNVAE